MSFVLLFLASAAAFALSTVAGGGAGLLLLPVLAQSLPGLAVPAALTIGTASSTVSKLALFRQSVRWDVTRLFVPGAVPGVLLGGFLLRYLNPLYLEVFIGLFLLSNVVLLFRRSVPTGSVAAPGRFRLVAIGFLAGFLSGLTGAVGLLFNGFYFRHGLRREEVIATRAANELLLHLLKLGLYFSLGLLTRPVWLAGLAVAFGAVLATSLTKRVVHRLPEQLFRRIGYAAMVLSGGFMLTSATTALRTSQNIGASLQAYGRDVEVTGWWSGGSVSLEWEYNEGLAVEHQIAPRDLPPAARQVLARQLAGGRRLVKAEEVWEGSRTSYELYLNHRGRLEKVELPAH